MLIIMREQEFYYRLAGGMFLAAERALEWNPSKSKCTIDWAEETEIDPAKHTNYTPDG